MNAHYNSGKWKESLTETPKVRASLEKLGERLTNLDKTIDYLEDLRLEYQNQDKEPDYTNPNWLAAEMLFEDYFTIEQERKKDVSMYMIRFKRCFNNSFSRLVVAQEEFEGEFRRRGR